MGYTCTKGNRVFRTNETYVRVYRNAGYTVVSDEEKAGAKAPAARKKTTRKPKAVPEAVETIEIPEE